MAQAYVVQNDVDRVPSGSAIITDRTASGFEVGDPIVFYNPALETDNKIMFQYISEIDGDIYKTVNAANENPVDVSGNMLRGLAVSFTPFVGTVFRTNYDRYDYLYRSHYNPYRSLYIRFLSAFLRTKKA